MTAKPSAQSETLTIAAIVVPERLRRLSSAHTEVIAASMGERGLLQPITVRDAEGVMVLVAGAHRLAAAKLLKWREISAIITGFNEREAKLAEIDENLCRHELSALDRAFFLAERKALYEALHPETKHGGDRRSKKAQQLLENKEENQTGIIPTWSFSEDTAQKTRLHPDTIRRAVYLAKNLDSEARRLLEDSPLADKEGELHAIARKKPEDQRRIVTLLLSGKPDAPTSVSHAVTCIRGGQPKLAKDAHVRWARRYFALTKREQVLGLAELSKMHADFSVPFLLRVFEKLSVVDQESLVTELGSAGHLDGTKA